MKQSNRRKSAPLSGTALILLDLVLAAVLTGLMVLFYSGLLISRVPGVDMDPTYKSMDFLLGRREKEPDRYDIICFRAGGGMLGDREKDVSLRRVVGLPGETVEIQKDGAVIVNGQALEETYLTPELQAATYREGTDRVTLGENEYYVLGDFRPKSVDSRNYGAVSGAAIVGIALNRPNMFLFLLTIVAPLCIALVLFWLLDRWLRQLGWSSDRKF